MYYIIKLRDATVRWLYYYHIKESTLMRLTNFEKQTIIDICKKYDDMAEIRLFGSRVDDTKKGGDIDLLIFSKKLTRSHVRKIKNDLCEILGEQRIDIIIAEDDSQSFVKLAKRGSVLL